VPDRVPFPGVPSQWQVHFIPTPQYSFLIIVLVAFVSSVAGLLTSEVHVTALPVPVAAPPISMDNASRSRSASDPLSSNLATMVVRLTDVLVLSPAFEVRQDQSGDWSNEAAAAEWPDPSSALSRYQRWGRTGGYSSVLWRAQPAREMDAPLEIRSRVSLYRNIQGAHDAFKEEQGKLIGPNPQMITVPQIGETTAAYRVGNGPFIVFLVVFQKGNGVGSLITTSLAEEASLQVAINLAALMAEEMR